MSRLQVGDDDHADAASKHWEDVKALSQASRHDGAAYLSGYVVECTLKAIILHDKSYDATTDRHDTAELRRWHGLLSRRPYGHDLVSLAGMVLGPEGDRYMPDLPRTAPGKASVLEWKETLRYQGPGRISNDRCNSYQQWAELVHDSILRMRADRVL